MQADGAGYAIRTDPELAESAVRTISETGREALMELRRLLDVLRATPTRASRGRRSRASSGLPELVDKVTAVGLPVRLTVQGRPRRPAGSRRPRASTGSSRRR